MGNEKSVPLRFGRFKGNRIFAHKSIKVMAKNYLLETLREQKRMQLKGGIYHKVQIDLTEQLRDFCEFMQPAFEEKGLSFQLDLPEHPLMVQADK